MNCDTRCSRAALRVRLAVKSVNVRVRVSDFCVGSGFYVANHGNFFLGHLVSLLVFSVF